MNAHSHKYAQHDTSRMKQKLPVFAALLILAAALWAACTKPSPFGSGLLENELAEYEFTDTLSVVCTVELEEDSLETSDGGSTSSAFLCGELDDPYFGKSKAEIFALLQMAFPDPGFKPDSQTVDSLVLYLRYAPGNFYGDSTQAQTLQVLRLDEPLEDENDYYSESTIPASTELGRLQNFLPRPNTVDSLFDPDTKASYIAIPLNLDFANELFRLDTAILENDSAFYKALRGIKIVASSNAKPGAMLAFNLNSTTYSRLRLYYHDNDDSTSRRFDFYFSGANKFTHFEHDYGASPAGQKIGQRSDEYLYLQAMQGLRLKVEFPTVDALDNIAVNKAQLVLTTATLPDDYAVLTPAQQLVFTESQGDTTFVFTSDVLYSLGPALNLGFNRFGGFPEDEIINGTLVERYRLTLSDRLQKMVDDTSNDPKKKTLYININPQGRSAQRSVLYGPKNATFPAKLELKFTRVQ
ncbi:MAG: hypothetical protein EPGJADBJ_03999 [Saprospiraceae bacterium]|nr:hypothetical protein [Saprospiraceae bacterium]